LSDNLDESLADRLAQAITDTSSRFQDLGNIAGGSTFFSCLICRYIYHKHFSPGDIARLVCNDIRDLLKSGLFKGTWDSPQSRVASDAQRMITQAYTGERRYVDCSVVMANMYEFRIRYERVAMSCGSYTSNPVPSPRNG
jgi:hypothetical protein